MPQFDVRYRQEDFSEFITAGRISASNREEAIQYVTDQFTSESPFIHIQRDAERDLLLVKSSIVSIIVDHATEVQPTNGRKTKRSRYIPLT